MDLQISFPARLARDLRCVQEKDLKEGLYSKGSYSCTPSGRSVGRPAGMPTDRESNCALSKGIAYFCLSVGRMMRLLRLNPLPGELGTKMGEKKRDNGRGRASKRKRSRNASFRVAI